MLNTSVLVCAFGIAFNFLIQLFLNALILISPCDVPWMDGYGDDCWATSGITIFHHFACSVALFVSGLAGSLLLLKNKRREKSSYAICSAVLFGSFVQLINTLMYF